MNHTEAKLNQVVNGYKNYETNTGALNTEFDQKGGSVGFTHHLENPRIGGQPERIGYVSQPEYLDGKLVAQTNSDGRIVGNEEQCGGAKKLA